MIFDIRVLKHFFLQRGPCTVCLIIWLLYLGTPLLYLGFVRKRKSSDHIKIPMNLISNEAKSKDRDRIFCQKFFFFGNEHHLRRSRSGGWALRSVALETAQ